MARKTLIEKLQEMDLIPDNISLEALILAEEILIDGKPATSKTQKIKPNSKIEHKSQISKYVSRGGFKLEEAIQKFQIPVKSKVCVDFGSSTGGFTDCLIHFGAKKVYAIEKGKNQLDSKLKENSKIISLEGRGLFDLDKQIFMEKIDLAVCDLSFVPLKKAIPKIFELTRNSPLIALLKPHYEVMNLSLLRNGKIKDEQTRVEIVNKFKDWLGENDFQLKNIIECSLKRAGRNLEYLCLIEKI